MSTIPFSFEAPLSFFEKADAGDGKQKRIAGIISTESPDRQGEVVLQRGLDLSEFVKNGWYNDNHTKDTDGILGYPEKVSQFRKGDRLPDGSTAVVNGTWAEGYLLDTEKGKRIWDLGKSLQKTGRRLGFSIEGRIERREGPSKKVIAKAVVRNVAITNCFPGYVRATGAVEALSRRWYSGPMVEVELATGHKLSGTPNHPVFTQRGWVALGELDEVHDRVGCHLGDLIGGLGSSPVVSNDVQDMPPTLEEVFNLALLSQPRARVRAIQEGDFHGDVLTDGQVDIVSVEGQLWDRLYAPFAKKFGERVLTASSLSERPLIPQSPGMKLRPASFASTSRLLGSLRNSFSFLRSALGVACLQRLSHASGDPLAYGYVVDSHPRNSESGSDAGRALSPAIGFSNLRSKRVFEFSGHVYNLQAKPRWYHANGVVVHNCPVNTDSRMEVLAKSLLAVERAEPSALEKALTVGTPTPGVFNSGTFTGAGAGQILSPESLESDVRDTLRKKKRKKVVQKSLTDAEAIAWVRERVPGASEKVAAQFIQVTRTLKASGRL